MGWVWFIKSGLGWGEGRGVKAGVSRCIIGGSVVFVPEGKMLSNIQRFQEIFKKKKQVLTFIERINMHTMPNL